MLTREFDGLVRPPDRPLHAGAEVPLDCGRVRVLDAPDGKPTRIEVTFDGDIEGDRFSFLVQDEGAFRKLPLPAQGESVVFDIHPAPPPF